MGWMSHHKRFTATVKTWRKGWEIHIEGLGVTQVRRLSEARERALDYIASLNGEEDASVDFHFDLGTLSEKVTAARLATTRAAQAQLEAAAQSREAAAELQDAGLSMSDIAVVMGVSRGRVSQILSSK